MKNCFKILVALLVLTLVVGCGSKGSSNTKPTKYLPSDASKYDLICSKKSVNGSNNIDEVVGVRKFTSYVSFSFAYVFSKQDGTAIEETESNKQNAENMRKAFGTSATAKFEDGKVVINYGTSDYSITDISVAKQQLTSNGYSCN